MFVNFSISRFENTYVIPFPNHEWVSSWTTTSTKVLSPASNAMADQVVWVAAKNRMLTWIQE